MALVAAKCTQCGSNLKVEDGQDAAICPFCHTPFITEKAINNYNTTNVTNIDHLHADVVNVNDENSLENHLKSGDTFIELGNYYSANEAFKWATSNCPYDYRGWWGQIRVNTGDFANMNLSEDSYNRLKLLYSRLEKVATPEELNRVSKQYSTYQANLESILADKRERIDKLKVEYDKNIEQINKRAKDINYQLEIIPNYGLYVIYGALGIAAVVGVFNIFSSGIAGLFGAFAAMCIILALPVGILYFILNNSYRSKQSKIYKQLKAVEQKGLELKQKLDEDIKMIRIDELNQNTFW